MAASNLFKNGYLKTIATVFLTLLVSALAVAAWTGITSPSKEDVARDYVHKDLYDLQQKNILERLDRIDKGLEGINTKLDSNQ